ncbi:hypothetical protein Mp_2g23870 [Marchantia polymorpha subsp. ruderalis]|uniref:Uncharacterized protein n=1 Tax=Marchantia polymorpha TaxID=3197 RepID=A0A2R6WPB4_MARPO|nr:hypothetical protein MARPO_0069s0037 [Marchantia polymorpha]BBN03485.1 hypothetical protein Mp_2g23870 [Marchantia polymorpha subsp. ruderalis]|eukprot:PTQ35692.1 hypothetical protein MARPO_0069s0037 [Marchantia polymorpha]
MSTTPARSRQKGRAGARGSSSSSRKARRGVRSRDTPIPKIPAWTLFNRPSGEESWRADLAKGSVGAVAVAVAVVGVQLVEQQHVWDCWCAADRESTSIVEKRNRASPSGNLRTLFLEWPRSLARSLALQESAAVFDADTIFRWMRGWCTIVTHPSIHLSICPSIHPSGIFPVARVQFQSANPNLARLSSWQTSVLCCGTLATLSAPASP